MLFNLLLFLFSVFLVLSSAFFIADLFKKDDCYRLIAYILLLIPAQIIFGVEVLSVFNALTVINLLLYNLLCFFTSFFLWRKYGKQRVFVNFNGLLNELRLSFRSDKFLLYLGVFFTITTLISFFLSVYAPVNQWDSATYHSARVWLWIQHFGIGHFETSSIRQVIFPPNAEIMVLWPTIFLKKDFFNGISQFYAYIGIVVILYSFLKKIKISSSRALWAVFVFASLPSVILQSSSSQNDLVLGFYILTSIFLYYLALKQKDSTAIAFSALSLAIAAGVKSSFFAFLPATSLIFLLFSIKFQNKAFYKSLVKFSFYFLTAFVLFSAYSYLLNYIDFKNFLGLESYIYEHTEYSFNIKSFKANIIRYFFAFFDFSGIDIAKHFSFVFYFLKVLIINALGVSESYGLTGKDHVLINTKLHENLSTFGILGFSVLLTLIFRSIKTFFNQKSDKTFVIGALSVFFIVSILTISSIMGYEVWNNRYLTTLIIIISPVLIYSYTTKLKLAKFFIFSIAVFYFIKGAFFNQLRPIVPYEGYSLLSNSRQEVKFLAGSIYDNFFREPVEFLQKAAPDESDIMLIFSDDLWYEHFYSYNSGWKIYPYRFELINNKQLENYDFVVISGEEQKVYNLNSKKPVILKNKVNLGLFNSSFVLVYKVKTILHQIEPTAKNEFVIYIYKNINNRPKN